MATKDTATLAAKQYDHDEAVGHVTEAKIEKAAEVNLEARPSRGATVGSPERVLAIGDPTNTGSTKDVVTRFLDARASGSASNKELDLLIDQLADSVGWTDPAANTEPANHEEDNLPPSRVEAQVRADREEARVRGARAAAKK